MKDLIIICLIFCFCAYARSVPYYIEKKLGAPILVERSLPIHMNEVKILWDLEHTNPIATLTFARTDNTEIGVTEIHSFTLEFKDDKCDIQPLIYFNRIEFVVREVHNDIVDESGYTQDINLVNHCLAASKSTYENHVVNVKLYREGT